MAQQVDLPNQTSSTVSHRTAARCSSIVGVSLAAAGGSVGDPDGTRAVTAIVALLAVLGLVLLMVAVWLFRTTRPDPEVLAPLEIMGDRGWRRADPVWQRRRLDEVRPEGAEPLQPSAAPPDLDEAFDLGPAGTGFDDLHDDLHDDRLPGIDVDPIPLPEPVATASPDVDPTTPVRRDTIVRISTEPPVQAELPLDPPPPPIDPLLAPRADDEARTPTGIARPIPEDLPDHDVDPELLAAAMAELDAELARVRRRRLDRDQA